MTAILYEALETILELQNLTPVANARFYNRTISEGNLVSNIKRTVELSPTVNPGTSLFYHKPKTAIWPLNVYGS